MRVFLFVFFIFSMLINFTYAIDLSGKEIEKTSPATESQMVYMKQWFENIDISGFGSFAFIGTGKDGNVSNEHFLAKEATLFVESKVWEDTFFFLEWQALRLSKEETAVAGQTGEVYVHYKNLIKDRLNLKFGRIDLPYGEEYLTQDSIDNPLVTWSVNWPYGWDEGALLYGNIGTLGWIFSVTDGSDNRSSDDHSSKAYNAKLYGDITPWLYLSGSYMNTGKTNESAMEFAGSHLVSVTGNDVPNIKASLYELDTILKFSQFKLWMNYGGVSLLDSVNSRDRTFNYYTVQPQYKFNEKCSLVARYSYIGTGKNDKGYHFDGKPYAGGNSDLGFDTKSLTRWSTGLSHQINPRAVLKFEYGKDKFEKISSSTRELGNRRDFYGIETSVKF